MTLPHLLPTPTPPKPPIPQKRKSSRSFVPKSGWRSQSSLRTDTKCPTNASRCEIPLWKKSLSSWEKISITQVLQSSWPPVCRPLAEEAPHWLLFSVPPSHLGRDLHRSNFTRLFQLSFFLSSSEGLGHTIGRAFPLPLANLSLCRASF